MEDHSNRPPRQPADNDEDAARISAMYPMPRRRHDDDREVLSAHEHILAAHADIMSVAAMADEDKKSLAFALRDLLIEVTRPRWIMRESRDTPGRFSFVSSTVDADNEPLYEISVTETRSGRFQHWSVAHAGIEIGQARSADEGKEVAGQHAAGLLTDDSDND